MQQCQPLESESPLSTECALCVNIGAVLTTLPIGFTQGYFAFAMDQYSGKNAVEIMTFAKEVDCSFMPSCPDKIPRKLMGQN